MDTTIKKGLNGWIAKTYIDLDMSVKAESIHEKEGKRYLVIQTSKGHRGVSTTASCCVVRPSHDGTHQTETHALFADYRKTLMNHDIVRATEKTITQGHELALYGLCGVTIAEAKAFYNKDSKVDMYA